MTPNPDDIGELDNAKRADEPDFFLGATGRHPTMPTPPGADVEEGDVITEHRSKTVMLRAERHDEIEVSLVVNGQTHVPKEYTVVRRDDTYYGPSLTLHAEVDDEDRNYMLTCPGPNTQLILWQALSGKEGEWRSGWIPIAEVTAQIDGTEQYRICDECGEPLRGIWHERLAAFGVPHDDPPRTDF